MMPYKQQLFINIIIIISTNLVSSYPNAYYENSQHPQATHQQSYDPYNSYYRYNYHPYRYYRRYPEYHDEYYYNPIYYLSPRAAKYSYYRHSLPYYYQELPIRSRYDYLSYMNPTLSNKERLMQAIASEQRENAQPIGHEVRFEKEDEDINDDNQKSSYPETTESNIDLLNNLMMQQVYEDSVKDSSNGKGTYNNQLPYEYINEEEQPEEVQSVQTVTYAPPWEGIAAYNQPINVEDEDVKELRELPRRQKQRKPRRRKLRKDYDIDKSVPAKRTFDNVFTYPEPRNYFQTTEVPTETESPTEIFKGQKEKVLFIPATPVKPAFKNTIMGFVDQQQEKMKREPSVYNRIKQLLNMEDRAAEPNAFDKLRKVMTKRLVSNEDTLTRQLSVLKKTEE